jgi:hypothetical protein
VHCHGQPEGYNVTTVSIAACRTATNAIAGVPVPCCCVHLRLAFALVASFSLHRLIVAQSSFTDRVHPQVRCGAA